MYIFYHLKLVNFLLKMANKTTQNEKKEKKLKRNPKKMYTGWCQRGALLTEIEIWSLDGFLAN